jgi:hypothetical protein
MISRRNHIAIVLVATLLAGCRSHASPPPSTAVTSAPTTSAHARDDAFRAAEKAVSKDAKVPRDSIAGVSQDETTWRDGCLGCPRPGEKCAQVLTPGYRVVLRVSDATYEYHTDMGGHARLCGQSPAEVSAVAPAYPTPVATPGSPQPTPTPYSR